MPIATHSKAPSFRSLLLWLTGIALVPASLMMIALAIWTYADDRQRASEDMEVAARVLSVSIDARLVQVQRSLERMARSIPKDRPSAFVDEAIQLRDAEQLDAIIVVTPQGEHVLNTRVPDGGAMPRTSPENLTGAIRRGMPVINDLYVAPIVGRPAIGVGIPIIEGNRVRYAVNAALEATRIRDTLLQHPLPAGWIATLVDSVGVIVARTVDHDSYVGRTAAPDSTRTPPGAESHVYRAAALSPSTGWQVFVEVPEHQLYEPLRRRLAAALMAIAVLVALVGWTVRRLYTRITTAVSGLGDYVRQLRDGKTRGVPDFGLREASEFAEVLGTANEHAQHATAALLDTERRYRGVLETAMDAIITIDGQHRIVLCNRSAERMFGFSHAEIEGKPVDLLLPERYRARHGEQVRSFASEQAAARAMAGERVVHGRRASGEEFPVEASISTMVDEQGRRWMTVIMRDVSERSREREVLVRNNLELQRFAFVASHDLRTPLRTVHGYLELIARECSGSAAAAKMIGRASEAVDHMEQLTSDLLSYARLDSRPARIDSVDMDAAVQSAIELLQSRIEETGAQVKVKALPVVRGNRTQLVQLWQNLVANACTYSTGTPEIQVSAERSADEWVFRVKDAGIGIEPQYLRKIFEPFKRLHSNQEYPGTGIGLAVCYRVVEIHGGRIWVESQPGLGSSFYFTIPSRTGDTHELSESTEPAGSGLTGRG